MKHYDDQSIMEQNVSSEHVFDGIILHIDHLTNRLPNGKLAKREVARHIGAAAVLPIDHQGNVYLVRQFRAPVDKVLLEIPAGKLDYRGENRLEAAKRELLEETGLTAGKWTHLNDLLTTVGFCDECIGIYVAQDLIAGNSRPDEDEFLNVIRMPYEEAVALVMGNEINDAKTVCALMMAKQLLQD
ncbi:MAG: NUDIX hydrolase [Christensenellales bacterium]|nr:NUDIX hydrolase [Christensenellales bacterium]